LPELSILPEEVAMTNYDELYDPNEELVLARFGAHVGTLLIDNGYGSLAAVRRARDRDLRKITGIGDSTLDMIRARQVESYVPDEDVGVSEDTATVESEVKPSTEAEAVEGGHADAPPTAEATAAPVDWTGVVAVRSLWPAAVKLVGPSGHEYFWPRAGAVINVTAEDVEFVLSRNRKKGRACCGGDTERIKFELA
jgi:hypothetical protein